VCEAKWQTFPARGSDRAAGQRPRAQRSLTVKSIFVTFDASNGEALLSTLKNKNYEKRNGPLRPRAD